MLRWVQAWMAADLTRLDLHTASRQTKFHKSCNCFSSKLSSAGIARQRLAYLCILHAAGQLITPLLRSALSLTSLCTLHAAGQLITSLVQSALSMLRQLRDFEQNPDLADDVFLLISRACR